MIKKSNPAREALARAVNKAIASGAPIYVEQTPKDIARKWARKIGAGFHPDTPADSYTPEFSAKEGAEYDRDMRALFTSVADPYEVCLAAMKEEGLI